MPEIKVIAVRDIGDDKLAVHGSVDDRETVGLGWVSWTKNYYDVADHPADLELADDMDEAERELAIQAHRNAILAIRRPMTQQELRAYCEQLLIEATPVERDSGLLVGLG